RDDEGAEVGLGEDVPEGLGAPGGAGGGAEAGAGGVGLDEVKDAVLVRGLAGGDGGPEERREHREERGEVGTDAAVDEAPEVGERAGLEEGVDDLPVRGVPADDEEALGGPLGHGGDAIGAQRGVRRRSGRGKRTRAAVGPPVPCRRNTNSGAYLRRRPARPAAPRARRAREPGAGTTPAPMPTPGWSS